MYVFLIYIMVLQGAGFQSIPERVNTGHIVIENVKEIVPYGRLSRFAFTLSGRSEVPVPTIEGEFVALAEPVVPVVLWVLSGPF